MYNTHFLLHKIYKSDGFPRIGSSQKKKMSDATEQSGLERAAEDTHIVQMLKQGINISFSSL